MEIPAVSRPIRLAAFLVGFEALALMVLAVAEALAIDADRVAIGATNAAFFLIYAIGLGFAAWGLLNLRRWCRGPIVLAQLIQLGVAYSFYGGGTVWVSVALAAVAVGVLVVMLAPATTQALYGHDEAAANDVEP